MRSAPQSIRERRYAVIGAGVSGLVAAKYLLAAGFKNVTIFELGSKIGGLWCYDNDNGLSSAYRTLHINSTTKNTHFHDYPFKDDVQPFPSHEDMYDYLVSYAEAFDLFRYIRFKTKVESVEPSPEWSKERPQWTVKTDSGDQLTFDRVILASGHLHFPRHDPVLKEAFQGQYVHSHDYREPAQFVGQRVCVVGAGNSAFDIAGDVCTTSSKTVLVARSPILLSPKLIFGKPFMDFAARLEHRLIPDRLRRWILARLTYLINGRMTDLGFKPMTKRAHGASNPILVQHIIFRRVTIKQGISQIVGKEIVFSDGSRGEFDVLVAATGYNYDIPFLSQSIASTDDNRLELYKRVVAPDWPGLYFIGFVNSTTGLPATFEHQVHWLMPIETGDAVLPSPDEMRADIAAKRAFIETNYYGSARHQIEEPHLVYLPELKKSRDELARRAKRERRDRDASESQSKPAGASSR
ncbi:MAG TPA: NAD(P)-binding domain-containing protein [Terriglobales bacterium]|nr:NAD(P)-binding domain-containing protein [Terriglobales bacterium]